MTRRVLMTMALALALGLLARPGQAQAPTDLVQLASAQVVPGADGLPSLVLAAGGPIAYEVVADDPSGPSAAPSRLRLRLYGVAAVPGFAAEPLAPFVVATQPEPGGLLLTIDALAPAGARPVVGRSLRASQLTIALAHPR